MAGHYIDSLAQVANNSDPSADDICDEKLYALQDQQFNVLALTDDAGEVVERYAYTLYGQRKVMNDQFVVLHRSAYDVVMGFQGLQHDIEAGLICNRARVLHPGLERFLQRDPLGYPDGMNSYAAYHVLRGGADPLGLSMEPLANKIVNILLRRMTRASFLGIVGQQVADLIGGSDYQMIDSSGELMADLVIASNVDDVYRAIATKLRDQGKIPADNKWYTVTLPRTSQKSLALSPWIFSGAGKLPGESEWWIGGAHDVFTQKGSTFQIKCLTKKDARIRKIDVIWEWHDRIDANSAVESWKRGGFSSVGGTIAGTIEALYDVLGDKILDTDFGVEIEFHDLRPKERKIALP